MSFASMDQTIPIWSWEEGHWTKNKATVFHGDVVRFVTFNANSCDMVTVSMDNTAQIWSLGKDKQWTQKATVSHGSKVDSACFSPDGRHVVIHICSKNRVEIWGLHSYEDSVDSPSPLKKLKKFFKICLKSAARE